MVCAEHPITAGTDEATQNSTYVFLCACNRQHLPPPSFLSGLFVGPNLNADVEGAATLNQKRIGHVIDKLQEVFLPEELPATSTKGIIVVNVPVNTEVIDVDGDRQSASSRLVRNRTKKSILELIYLMNIYHRVQPRGRNPFQDLGSRVSMQTNSVVRKGKMDEEQR